MPLSRQLREVWSVGNEYSTTLVSPIGLAWGKIAACGQKIRVQDCLWWVLALFSDMCNLECFPMEVSRADWKLHMHNLLHSMSELAYISPLSLGPLSFP